MASVLSEQEQQELQLKETEAISQKKQEFEQQGKIFEVPDEHWSGVMSEEYRGNLPGKNQNAPGNTPGFEEHPNG